MFPVRGYYWPPGACREDTVACWSRVFELHGYAHCENGDLEDGREKIAIYGKSDGSATHVARQLLSGA
jgi:hypothetical protein